jgi:cobyrinic acid a,c-diamide synthase
VVLVVNATKVTRTAAALVLGCQRLDPDVQIVGVIVNRVSGARHERIVREAIESVCNIPVLGAIPRAKDVVLLPSRHLGLVTPHEHSHREPLAQHLLDCVGGYLDFDRLLEISREAVPIVVPPVRVLDLPDGNGLTIGYLNDSAFCFYYPENLEALRAAGARLVTISGLTAASLPAGLEALYIGGGFPETHAQALSENVGFLASLRQAARSGLPIYAECGGLMYLSRALSWKGRRFPMAGVLDFEVDVCDTPQGHGYVELLVDRQNAFFPAGTRLRGHEFHYSKLLSAGHPPATACAVKRGTGCSEGRDAVVTENVWAAYTHLHALATPEWAHAMVRAARRRAKQQDRRQKPIVCPTELPLPASPRECD